MFGRKKNDDILYRVPQRELGHLDAHRAQAAVSQAQYLNLLQTIMKREGIPETEDVQFDSKLGAFVRVPAK